MYITKHFGNVGISVHDFGWINYPYASKVEADFLCGHGICSHGHGLVIHIQHKIVIGMWRLLPPTTDQFFFCFCRRDRLLFEDGVFLKTARKFRESVHWFATVLPNSLRMCCDSISTWACSINPSYPSSSMSPSVPPVSAEDSTSDIRTTRHVFDWWFLKTISCC